MRINQPNAHPMQASSFDRNSHLAHLRHAYLWQKVEQGQRLAALPKRTERKLRNDEGMNRNLASIQPFAHLFVVKPEMIDPNRSIGEDQPRPRRRGIFFNPGIVPPSAASLRPLSRSMSALSASRTKAVFSPTPVNSVAVRTSSSSSAMVVLIGINYSIK